MPRGDHDLKQGGAYRRRARTREEVQRPPVPLSNSKRPMTDKIEHPAQAIDRSTFRRGTVMAIASIHLTGGLRAAKSETGWSIQPLPAARGIGALRPVSRSGLDHFVRTAGLKIIGGDEISGMDGPLPARFWTPLPGQGAGRSSPADAWGAISIAAARSGDERTALIARKIAVTLGAADIRIRDASDCYHQQLLGALLENQTAGRRYKNVPLRDLFLAFHSLLAEMAGARDYIAEFAGSRLNAPDGVDALNRFERWATATSRADKAADPLAARLLGSREPGATNKWLADLTDYRNEFLHRMPMTARREGNSLIVVERQMEQTAIRLIELPIADHSAANAPGDALTLFVTLHERLLDLAAFAAQQSNYAATPPAFVVQ